MRERQSLDRSSHLASYRFKHGRVFRPIVPTCRSTAYAGQSPIAPAHALEDGHIFIVLNPVADPIQAHGGHNPLHPCLTTRLEEHPFAGTDIAVLSIPTHVLPWCFGPKIN